MAGRSTTRLTLPFTPLFSSEFRNSLAGMRRYSASNSRPSRDMNGHRTATPTLVESPPEATKGDTSTGRFRGAAADDACCVMAVGVACCAAAAAGADTSAQVTRTRERGVAIQSSFPHARRRTDSNDPAGGRRGALDQRSDCRDEAPTLHSPLPADGEGGAVVDAPLIGRGRAPLVLPARIAAD